MLKERTRRIVEIEPGTSGARLVLFGTRALGFAGRMDRRDRILAMHPVDPTEATLVRGNLVHDGRSRASHFFWEMLRPDDSSVMVRTADFDNAPTARDDGDAFLERRKELRTVFVRDEGGFEFSWWLALDNDVVAAATRIWPSTQRDAAARDARRAVRLLGSAPRWGRYNDAR